MAAPAATPPPLLEVEGVVVRFGGVVALAGVSFEVGHREIRGLIGPNGSGKTTLFNCISGLCRPAAGEIRFEGVALSRVPRHARARLGIGRTFQHTALFRSLTVRENVLAGAHPLAGSGFLANALRLGGRVRREEREAEETARRLLALLSLEAVADAPVGRLPFGTQKRVELARALAAGPKLLLLDEPAGGLNHEEVYRLARLLFRIRREFELSILLVEHHMHLVTSVSDRVVALDFGEKIADGTPEAVRAEPAVIRAYLGEGAAAHGDAA